MWPPGAGQAKLPPWYVLGGREEPPLDRLPPLDDFVVVAFAFGFGGFGVGIG